MVASGTEPAALPPLAEVGSSPSAIVREALFDDAHSGTLVGDRGARSSGSAALDPRSAVDGHLAVVSALAHELADARARRRATSGLLVLAARLDRVIMIAGRRCRASTSESMTREAAWRFLDMGRRLERALNTALMIERTLPRRPTRDETPLLEALLDAADSAMTYRRRYRATLQVAPVVDLLVADERNPRVDRVPAGGAGRARRRAAARLRRCARAAAPEERIAFEALSAIRLVDVEAVCAPRRARQRPARR